MKFDLTDAIYYFLPKRCAICGRVISKYDDLCKFCKDDIVPIKTVYCTKCGSAKRKCDCSRYVYHFRGVVAPFINKDSAQEAIYRYKFNHNGDAAGFFAKYMAEYVKTYFSGIKFDCITAVPMHPKKKRITGFDHTDRLARSLSKELDLPYKRMLIKKKFGKTQHKLKVDDRFSNAFNAYCAVKNNFNNVLLVDDIKTTGATLDACSRELMLSGTENVYCVTAVIG